MPSDPQPAAPAELWPARSGGWLVRWVKPLVTVGLYALVFATTDIAAMLSRLAGADLGWVAAGVLLYAAGQVLSAAKWQSLIRPLGLVVSSLRVLAFYFVGMFFNLFLPTIVGGDAVKAILLARETGAPARSTMSVFMERNTGLLALLTIATTAAALGPPIEVGGVPLVAVAALLFVGYVGANIVLFNPHAYRLVDRLVAATPLGRVRARAASLYTAITPYKTAYGALALAVGLSFIFQGVVIAVVYLNTRALHQSFPLAAVALFVPLISLAGMLPVSLNGLGLREALYIVLFGRLGAPPDVSVGLALLYLAVTFTASLPGGLVYALQKTPARLLTTPPVGGTEARSL